MTQPFLLPKSHPDMPENYGIKITGHDGKIEDFEVATHTLFDLTRVYNPDGTYYNAPSAMPFFELKLKDTKTVLIPQGSYKFFQLDERWDKTVEIKEKLAQQESEKVKKQAAEESK